MTRTKPPKRWWTHLTTKNPRTSTSASWAALAFVAGYWAVQAGWPDGIPYWGCCAILLLAAVAELARARWERDSEIVRRWWDEAPDLTAQDAAADIEAHELALKPPNPGGVVSASPTAMVSLDGEVMFYPQDLDEAEAFAREDGAIPVDYDRWRAYWGGDRG